MEGVNDRTNEQTNKGMKEFIKYSVSNLVMFII